MPDYYAPADFLFMTICHLLFPCEYFPAQWLKSLVEVAVYALVVAVEQCGASPVGALPLSSDWKHRKEPIQ